VKSKKVIKIECIIKVLASLVMICILSCSGCKTLEYLVDLLPEKEDVQPPPPPPQPPVIDEAEKYKDGPSTISHGKSGFLWKPISDNTGFPVLLLPPRFTNKTQAVTCNDILIYCSAVANGYRGHYRLNQHYTGALTIKAVATDGIGGASYLWTWIIPDASQRYDSNVTPTIEKL